MRHSLSLRRDEVGLDWCKVKPIETWIESAWFQLFNLTYDKLVQFSLSNVMLTPNPKPGTLLKERGCSA